MKLTELFHSLAVPIAECPDNFKKWLAERFPAWTLADEFCQALPAAWTLISAGNYDLCYLSDSETIYNTCRRLDASPAFKQPSSCQQELVWMVDCF